jgi:hypothetical protein
MQILALCAGVSRAINPGGLSLFMRINPWFLLVWNQAIKYTNFFPGNLTQELNLRSLLCAGFSGIMLIKVAYDV